MEALKNIINDIKEVLNYTLIKSGKNLEIRVSDLLEITILIVATAFALHIIKRGVYKTRKLDFGKKYSIYNLIRYIVIVLVFGWTLDILGFNLKIVLAGSAALLVGVGLGLQNLFSDFVSGIILLIDSSIKVGDVIDINELVCQVQQINLRTTLVLTRDDKYILLPNTQLTKNQLINWTHSVSSSRFHIDVGVDYGSDIQLVTKLLKDACEAHSEILKNPAPFVRFNDFGNSSLDFTVYFWCSNVFRVENVKSELRYKIFELFAENEITIPFPQRTLHFHRDANEVQINQ